RSVGCRGAHRARLPAHALCGKVPAVSDANNRQRAEFPPTGYWRRWCEDAAPAALPSVEAAPEPVAAPPPPSTSTPARPGQDAAPWRALIVDDEPSQALFPESVLTGAGMQAQVASVTSEVMASTAERRPSQALFAESVLNGAGMQAQVASVSSEVMAAMEQLRPDLVLMDLHMPGLDGAELTALIREHSEFAPTPIVFLTGDEDPERRFEAL